MKTKFRSGKFRKYWLTLVGKPGDLSRENRGFNVVSIYVIGLIAVLVPLNFYLGLWKIAAVLLVTEVLLVTMFSLSRYWGLHRIGLTVYAIASYVLLIFTYLFNGGSDGPVLFAFLLTYSLLITFTGWRQHWIWTVLHLLIPAGLLAIEYFHPEMVMVAYDSRQVRFTDLITAFPIFILCIFAVTNYLRRAYERERLAAEKHAKQIDAQHEHIKVQNQLLQEANREKIELISILGHDLRNPMSAITGSLEILATANLPPQQQKKLNADLLMAARNTSDLLNNVLVWASGQIKGISPLLTWVEPGFVIQRVLTVQRFIAEQKGIGIQVQVQDDVAVYSDADMLELIIRNLVNNALKFTSPGGTITLIASPDETGRKCLIAVHDDGIGMTSEEVKDIFNGQIQSTYGTDSEKGMGLGLLLCRELTMRLGGEIWAESELGKGSVFHVALPLYTGANPPDGQVIPEPLAAEASTKDAGV